MHERLGIAGSGAIACGLAAAAARHGRRSCCGRDPTARRERARGSVAQDLRAPERRDQRRPRARGDRSGRARRGDGASSRRSAEDEDGQVPASWATSARVTGDDALLATTTSSLSVERLAQASGAPERFVGLHVFNPVPKMKLVELAFPAAATDSDAPARPRRCARRSTRPPSRSPTCRASWSTACSSPTSSARSSFMDETGMEPGGRRPVHDARRRAPDGAARAAGLRRPRRRRGHRRRHRRRRPAAPARRSSPRARLGTQDRPRSVQPRD